MAAPLCLWFALTLFSGPVDKLVLRSGETIAIRQVVEVGADRIIFRSADGGLFSLPLGDIDIEKTTSRPPKPSSPQASPVAASPVAALAVSPEEKERLLRALERSAGQGAPPSDFDRGGEAEQAKSTAEDKKSDESVWRQRARAVRARVERATAELENAIRYERQLNAFLLFMAGPDGIPENYSNYMRELENTRSRIPQLREEVESARSAENELRVQAQRAGAMPGWLH